MHYKKYGMIAIIIFMLAVSLYGQEVVVPLLPDDGTPATYVNNQIVADTLAAGGMSANRVYELQRDGYYFHNAILTVPNGRTLRLRAAEGSGAKPIIYLWEAGTEGSPTRPPGNWVVLNGGNLEVKNICVAGFYEYEPERVDGVQGGLIQTSAVGSTIILDGVVLSNINGQHVRTNQNTVKVQVTNSIFANMGDLKTSNLGAGKGFDLREAACDSFIVVNNTFVNFQDRAIRHYNFNNPAAGTGLIGYGRIDHNTFVNGMGYHGLFSLGNVGPEITITNNLFVDAFALGEDSTDFNRAAEWANTGEFYPNGLNRITWVFSAPNATTQWTISNNYYAIGDSGWAFLNDFGFPPGSPLSYHINSMLGADSVNAFAETELSLTNTPKLMMNMMRWYEDPAGGNKSKDKTNFVRARDDYDRRMMEYYRDSLDCAYPAGSEAYVGAELGYPAGDLNWFPDLKEQWEGGTAPLAFVIDAEKDAFYDQLTGPDDGYLQLRYYAWNNNGKPDDDADLSAKMWFAWDNNWLYFYEEVKDDTISMTSVNTYNNDGWEIKIDPQATDSTQSGGSVDWAQAMTALYTAGTAGHTDGLADKTQMQTARKITADGYVLECAINWSAIVAGTEAVSVGEGNVFGCAVQNHDNDNTTGARDATVQWAAVLMDQVWNTPKYLGTVEFLADNKLKFIPSNNMTGVTNEIPYNGSDYERTAVGETIAPYVYTLNQNYPNPFNPTTKITFSLRKAANTTLTVYNMLGQKVATPFAGKLSAGKHEINFDASNLSNGVYFYKLESGENKSMKKMLLMK
jgi:hypothetical protein